MSESRWKDHWTVGQYRDAAVPYHPGIRITEGMRVALPGGGWLEVHNVVKDDEGNPGVLTLTLEPVEEDS